MASAADIIADLKDANMLLTAQSAAGANADEVLESMYNSWLGRLACCSKMQPKSKAAITDALSEGPWKSDQKKIWLQ